jgi:hypothetical protein
VSATKEDWVRAYALQALSDLAARDALVEAGVEKCHRLHFLQMAAEKTCKAHLTAANGHDAVRKTHAYVAKVLPIIANSFYARLNGDGRMRDWQLKRIKHFAREIEVIAPACDAGDVREDNSEYPWVDGHGDVQTPCHYDFPNLDDHDKSIVDIVKLIRAAAESYAR